MKTHSFTKFNPAIVSTPSAAILLEDAYLCVNCNLIHGERSCPHCCSDHAINLSYVLNHGRASATWHTPA